MHSALIALHYFICLFLIGVILLQAGKGADIGAAFGGASQTVFGGRGPATFLSKLTTVAAILFLVTSVWLAQISKTSSAKSVLDTVPVTTESAVPMDQQATTEVTTPVNQPATSGETQPASPETPDQAPAKQQQPSEQ